MTDLKDAILDEDPLFQIEIIGNGLYITHTDPNYVFNFATPEGQLMKITTEEVNNISDLPSQCKGGYIVKIANTDLNSMTTMLSSRLSLMELMALVCLGRDDQAWPQYCDQPCHDAS